MDTLLENKTLDFLPPMWDGKKRNFEIPNDEDYLKFLYENNGGYYYNNSIHIFGFTANSKFHDIVYMNIFLKNEYQTLFSGICFAEDIFGNLFSFTEEGIILFEIETGNIEVVSKNFAEWCDIIVEESDYYGGTNLLEELDDKNLVLSLSKGYRLAPKMPFILQGEYDTSNLVLKTFEENITFNSNLAKQIASVPDGTTFKINFDNPDV